MNLTPPPYCFCSFATLTPKKDVFAKPDWMQPDKNYQHTYRLPKAHFPDGSIEESPNFLTYPKHTLKTPALRPTKPGFHHPNQVKSTTIWPKALTKLMVSRMKTLPPPTRLKPKAATEDTLSQFCLYIGFCAEIAIVL